MKRLFKHSLSVVTLALLSATPAVAITNLTISVEGTNVVLAWPSASVNTYLIQYRASLDTNSPWVNLTNNFPAATGTNVTHCLIEGVVPPLTVGGGGGGGGAPPPPFAASGGESFFHPLFDMWQLEGRDPYVWEVEKRPPYPWEAAEWNKLMAPYVAALNAFTMQGGASLLSSSGEAGFFRVFQEPDWDFTVTNYFYDGPTFLPVDFADYLDHIDSSEVLLNGELSPYAVFLPFVSGGQTNWGMGIYFDRMASGTYQIQLRTSVQLSADVGEDTSYVVLSNRTASIVVNNQVTFTDWNSAIQGDTYTFRAQTANLDTDWQIDIYDAWDNYVNGGSGHTSNGQIAWTWDLRDTLGELRDDLDFDPFLVSYITFNTTGSGFQPAAATTRQQPQASAYPNVGEWVVSFQDRWFSDAPAYPGDSQQHYEDGIGGVMGGPLLIGDPAQWFPLPFGTNVYSQAERNAGWANLKDWLGEPHIRNWYYYGHGAGSHIGDDMHTFDTNGFVTGGTLTSAGSKSKLLSWEVWRAVQANRYRFVFLDGCNTAVGNWPATFNISKQTNDLSFYQNHSKHPRPSAFVGWNTTPGGSDEWGTIEKYFEFRASWMGYWVNSFPPKSLVEALNDANRDTPWITADLFRKSIRIYGYIEMEFQDYNHKSDWNYP